MVNIFFLRGNTAMSAILLLIGILSFTEIELMTAQPVGVCYGDNYKGNNVPSPKEVVDLYKSNGIGGMRIYYPNEGALEALRGSNIEVILDVPSDNLQHLTNAEAARDWVNKNVKAYSDVKFKYIAVGNEVGPSDSAAQYVLQAMQNIQNEISSANLQGQIKVSTAIKTDLVSKPYPPNDGFFKDSVSQYINPILNFLKSIEAPLLATVYPYFAYFYDQNVPLEYALFTQQGTNEVGYQNLFDAMLDSLYAALEKAGASNVNVVVSESGWPSEGGVGADVDKAGTYYRNLISHIKSGSGTPKRPNRPIETYLFAMFDENEKPNDETEKHFGLFSPNTKSPKYPSLTFN